MRNRIECDLLIIAECVDKVMKKIGLLWSLYRGSFIPWTCEAHFTSKTLLWWWKLLHLSKFYCYSCVLTLLIVESRFQVPWKVVEEERVESIIQYKQLHKKLAISNMTFYSRTSSEECVHYKKIIKHDMKSVQILDAPNQHIALVNCQLRYPFSSRLSKKKKEIIWNLAP